MTLIGIAFANDSNLFIPYASSLESGFASLMVFFCLIGLFGNFLVLASILVYNLRHRNQVSHEARPRNLLLMSLVIGDLVMCAYALPSMTNIREGGWAIGKEGCISNNAISTLAGLMTLVTTLLLALERYLSIFHAFDLSTRRTSFILVLCWLFAIFLGFFPSLSGRSDTIISLEPSKLLCMICWYCRDPFSLGLVIIFFIASFVTAIVLLYTSVKIISFYRASLVKRDMEVKGNVLDTQLVRRAILLTGSLIILWTPFILLILIQVITGLPPNTYFDSIASIAMFLKCTINPFILIIDDRKVRSDILALVGMEGRYKVYLSTRKVSSKSSNETPLIGRRVSASPSLRPAGKGGNPIMNLFRPSSLNSNSPSPPQPTGKEGTPLRKPAFYRNQLMSALKQSGRNLKESEILDIGNAPTVLLTGPIIL